MYLVLCDVCKKNTNQTHAIGTVTRTYTRKAGERVLKGQDFSTQILNVEIGDEMQERMHVCSPCFSEGLTKASAQPALASAT